MTNSLATLSRDMDRVFNALHRNSIGYDWVPSLFDDVYRAASTSFPPYDIVKTGENEFELQLALAGYSPEDLSVTVENGSVIVASERSESKDDKEDDAVLYRGIAKRSFRLSYRLNENTEVRDASLDNGLLSIKFERVVPEEQKPRQIEIKTAQAALEHMA